MALSRLLAHALVVTGLALGLAEACTIASPTHITVEPTKTTNGTDPKTGDDDDAVGAPSGGNAVSCSSSDFTKPNLAALTACGNGQGHCFDRDKTPMADQLVACDDPSQVCVPDDVLEADGTKLASCSVQVLGGKPGACVTGSLYSTIIQQGGDALKRDVCADGQLCVPCTDPTHNNAPSGFCEPIGVHRAACAASAAPDAAAPAPTEYCCTTNGNSNGICIDKSAIPDDQLSKTIRDTCHGTNEKCVPKAMVEGNPVTCNSGIAGKGVCMDKCFSSMMGTAASIGALKQDVCGDTEVCVPCLYAGKATPGCN